MPIKTLLFATLLATLTLLSIASYPIALELMVEGQSDSATWSSVVYTNKNWLFLFSIMTIGGCLAYLFTKLVIRRNS